MLKNLGCLFCLLGVYSLLYVVDLKSFALCLSLIGIGAWMIFRRKKVWS